MKKIQKKSPKKTSKPLRSTPASVPGAKRAANIHSTKAAKPMLISEPVLASSAPTPITFDENHPYWHVINQVIDPEMGIGIADMGIIYDVQQKEGVVDVKMTLTSMGCPAGPDIVTNLDAVMRMEAGVKDVMIEVVWDPMWTPDRMKPEMRSMLWGGF